MSLKSEALLRSLRKQAERACVIGRERERELIDEAKEELRLTRWRRQQLRNLDSKAS